MTQQRVPAVIQRIRAQRAQREAASQQGRSALQARAQAARASSQTARAEGLRTEPLPPFPGNQSPFIPSTAPEPEGDSFGFNNIGGMIKAPFSKGLQFLDASAKTGSAAALTVASGLAPSSSFGQEFRGELTKAKRQGKGLYGSLRQAQEEVELPKFVKGLTEFVFDPLNLIPTTFIAKPVSFAARAGLRGVKSGAALAGAKTLGRAGLQQDALGVGEGVVKMLEPTARGPNLEAAFAENLDAATNTRVGGAFEGYRVRTRGRPVDIDAIEAAEQKAIRAEGRAGVRVEAEPMTTHEEFYSGPVARLRSSELGERIRDGRWIPTKPDITLPVGGAFRWMFDWTNPAIALQRATPLAKIAHLFRARTEDAPQQVSAAMAYIKAMKIPERLIPDENGLVNIKDVGKVGRSSEGVGRPIHGVGLEGSNEIAIERVLQSALDNPGLLALLSKEEIEYIMVAKGTIDGFRRLALKGGVDMAEWGGLEELFPRYVSEIRGIEVSPLGSRAPGASPALNNPRIILDSEVEEAIYAGKVKYLGNVNAQIEAFGSVVYKALRDNDLARAVEPFSKGLDAGRTQALRDSIAAGKFQANSLTKLKKSLIAISAKDSLKLKSAEGEKLKDILLDSGLDDDIDILMAKKPKNLNREEILPKPEKGRATRDRTVKESKADKAKDIEARKEAMKRIRARVDADEAAAKKLVRESASREAAIKRMVAKGRGPIDPDRVDAALREDIANGNIPIQSIRDDSGRIPPALWAMQFTEDELKILEEAINVNKSWFDNTLEATGQAGDVARVLKAGFDFGAPFIQNLPLLATNPEAWARSTKHMFKAFADERVHWEFMAQHMDTVRKLQRHNVPVGTRTTDFVDAIGRGGTLEQIGKSAGRAAAKLESEKIDKVLAKVGRKASRGFRKFEVGFEAPLDMGRILQWEALEPTILKSAKDKSIDEATALAGLAQYLRNSTGALSTTPLGIGRSRQAFERGFLFFSPRYTRASIALMADAMHGGIEGQLARQAIGKMMAGGVMVHNAFAAALDQDPNFDPLKGDFLTLNIGGDHIGPGTIFTQMVRASARTGEKILEGDVGAFASLSTRDNPIAGFVRGRGAPGGGLAWDLMTGSDYLGEPLERGLSTRTAGHVAAQVAPFVVESALMSSPKRQNVAGILGGALGLRTYPLSHSETRTQLRDEVALSLFSDEYKNLNGLQKEKVNNAEGAAGDALRDVTEKARGNRVLRGKEIDRTIEDFNQERKTINDNWNASALRLENRFTTGEGFLEGLELREQLKLENRIRRERMRDLNASDEGIEVREYFDGLRERLDTDERPEDYAYQLFLSDVLFNEDFIDPDTGEILYSERDRAEGQFLDTWGEEVVGYVQARLSEGFEITPYAEELTVQRERFRYYWDASSTAVISSRTDGEYVGELYKEYTRASRDYKQVMLDQSPTLKSAVDQIGKVRKSLRKKDQELDGFLHRWYGLTLQHPENQWDGATKHYKKAIPMMDSYLP